MIALSLSTATLLTFLMAAIGIVGVLLYEKYSVVIIAEEEDFDATGLPDGAVIVEANTVEELILKLRFVPDETPCDKLWIVRHD